MLTGTVGLLSGTMEWDVAAGHAVVAAIEYPYHGAPNPKGLAVVREVPAIRRAILDTPPAILLALDYLLAQRDVDSARVKLRHRSAPVPARVAASNGGFTLELEEPAYAVATGQVAALYDGGAVVGAGVITDAR